MTTPDRLNDLPPLPEPCKNFSAGEFSAVQMQAYARAAIEAAQLQGAWMPIASAPKDGLPLRLFAEGFINEDFNPGGSVEGQWCDDLGWVGAVWNPEQDVWDTNQIVPTHFQHLPPPPQTREQDNKEQQP